MRAFLEACQPMTDATYHHAFTDLCRWKGRYFLAYRVAPTHNIVPPGHVVIARSPADSAIPPLAQPWAWASQTVTHPVGDIRDPKFLVTPDVLYLFCGLYVPHVALHQDRTSVLMPTSVDNIVQTHVTYTTTGDTWAPLTPILRPNYWGWSAVHMRQKVGGLATYAMASYHVGTMGDATSIALWLAESPRAWALKGIIYEAGSTEYEGGSWRYPHMSVTEPVLWYDQETDILGCCLRSESPLAAQATLTLGYGRSPYDVSDWRWHTTPALLHPSAILHTPYGLVLAAREVTLPVRRPDGRGTAPSQSQRPKAATALYHLEGHRLTRLLRLPSGGDTAYAGLAPGPTEGTLLLSYYSTHEVPTGVPGARVYVATLRLAEGS